MILIIFESTVINKSFNFNFFDLFDSITFVILNVYYF